jgi:hypothetical protein
MNQVADAIANVGGVDPLGAAVLHGSVGGRTEPAPSLCLSDADGLRAPKLKHAVQGLNGDGDLRRATSVRS